MALETGAQNIAELRAMLAQAPLEDVAEAVRARRGEIRETSPAELAALERELCTLVAKKSYGPWADRKKAARAFRFYLDVALEQGFEDGDTRTWALIRALAQDPNDDELLREYVRAVADTDYRYTDLSLAEIAANLSDPGRARWLATLDTIVEYFVLRAYLDPPQTVYVQALEHSFQGAVARGADEAGWQKARAWVLDAAPFATIPENLFARYATRT